MLYAKSIHIIFMVSWFAALFYQVRLFVYFAETKDLPEVEKNVLQKQYKIMQGRLWNIIGWPSAILTVLSALYMLYEVPAYLKMPWMHVKLFFVVLLLLYHMSCQMIMQQQRQGIIKYSSTQLRIWNEVATIILFSVVFLVVLKDALNWIYGLGALMGISITLMIAIKWYKKQREK